MAGIANENIKRAEEVVNSIGIAEKDDEWLNHYGDVICELDIDVDDIKDFKEDSYRYAEQDRIYFFMRHAIGHRLSEVRGLLGLSQKEFGRQIGVSYQHVSKYERGLIMPGVEVLVKIYECFSVNINWLLTGKGPAFLEGHKISLEEDIKSKESILKWIEIFWNTSTHDKKTWFIIEFQRYFQSSCDKLPRKTKDKNIPHR